MTNDYRKNSFFFVFGSTELGHEFFWGFSLKLGKKLRKISSGVFMDYRQSPAFNPFLLQIGLCATKE